jgi:hypothetical protein
MLAHSFLVFVRRREPRESILQRNVGRKNILHKNLGEKRREEWENVGE